MICCSPLWCQLSPARSQVFIPSQNWKAKQKKLTPSLSSSRNHWGHSRSFAVDTTKHDLVSGNTTTTVCSWDLTTNSSSELCLCVLWQWLLHQKCTGMWFWLVKAGVTVLLVLLQWQRVEAFLWKRSLTWVGIKQSPHSGDGTFQPLMKTVLGQMSPHAGKTLGKREPSRRWMLSKPSIRFNWR